MTTKKRETVSQKAARLERELENFKKQVVSTTVEWEGGCDSGKQQFLEELGLEFPTSKVRISLEAVLDPDGYSVSSISELIDNIKKYNEISADVVYDTIVVEEVK